MILINNVILLFLFCVTNTWAHSLVDLDSNDLNQTNSEVKLLDNNNVDENNQGDPEKVLIQLYYESLCPHCVNFLVNEFAPVVEAMSSYLDIQTYPFGNAMIMDENGTLEFKCQHGPAECYGNKLHACALDQLQNNTALDYNICLMNSTENLGSDDKSADRCAKSMDIDSEPIKECAKGTKGMELLRYYGEESEKAKYSHVPYILISGEVFDGDDFKNATCNALANQPLVYVKLSEERSKISCGILSYLYATHKAMKDLLTICRRNVGVMQLFLFLAFILCMSMFLYKFSAYI